MRRRLMVLLAIFGAIGLLAAPGASAQQDDLFGHICDDPDAQSSPACRDTSGDDPLTGEDGVVIRVINAVSVIAGIIAVFMIIWGGFKYITSSGDGGKAKSALDTITWAVVGLVVIVLAQAVVSFILTTIL